MRLSGNLRDADITKLSDAECEVLYGCERIKRIRFHDRIMFYIALTLNLIIALSNLPIIFSMTFYFINALALFFCYKLNANDSNEIRNYILDIADREISGNIDRTEKFAKMLDIIADKIDA